MKYYFIPFLIWFAAAAAKSLQSCPTLRPQRRQPNRLPHPWDSPGKNTGVGCHFLLQCMKVKSKSEVAQSCPTPSNPVDWWHVIYIKGFPSVSAVRNLPAKAKMQIRSLGWEDPLVKAMTTHSSILAWEIPRTEEPSRLHEVTKELDMT